MVDFSTQKLHSTSNYFSFSLLMKIMLRNEAVPYLCPTHTLIFSASMLTYMIYWLLCWFFPPLRDFLRISTHLEHALKMCRNSQKITFHFHTEVLKNEIFPYSCQANRLSSHLRKIRFLNALH